MRPLPARDSNKLVSVFMAITRRTEKTGKIPIFSEIERNWQQQRENWFRKVNNNTTTDAYRQGDGGGGGRVGRWGIHYSDIFKVANFIFLILGMVVMDRFSFAKN